MTLYRGSGPVQASLDGKINWRQGRGIINVNTQAISVLPSELGGLPGDIQKALDKLAEFGGTLNLKNGTYLPDADIVIPNFVILSGENADSVVIDFQGESNQVRVEGSNVYQTGSVAVVNGSNDVVGTGTSWDTGMIGQQILIYGVWYVISDVTSTTALIIEGPFDSPDVTGEPYVIADPCTGHSVLRLTIQNSSHAQGGLLLQHSAGGDLEGVSIYSSEIGFNFLDCSFVSAEDVVAVGCTVGINVDNCGVWTFNDFAAYSCIEDNMRLNRFFSASISNATFSSAGGNGIRVTESSNMSIYDMNLTTNGDNGLEISDSHGIQVFSVNSQNNANDGIKLHSNANSIVMGLNSELFNGGWGINIDDASCENNVIIGNTFDTNVSGEYDDNGTDTVIIQTGGGGGGGTVDSVVAGSGVDVDATDPANPIVSVEAALAAIAGLSPAANDFMIFTGGNWANRTPAQARTHLGLGTLATASTVTEADITLADNTTNNFNTSRHGFVPKGLNAGKFLKDDGTWDSIPGGGDALTSNPLSQFAATTSLQLKGVMSDETGSGALVFATSPTLVTPALGTPSSVNLANATGLKRFVTVDSVEVLNVDPANTTFTDLDLTAATSPTAYAVTGTIRMVTAVTPRSASVRKNGSSSTAVSFRGGANDTYVGGFVCGVDASQILEWQVSNADVTSLIIHITGYWEDI